MSDPTTYEEAFDAVTAELRELMVRKQRDYGHGNILSFGELGVLVRSSDKLERLKNLHKRGQAALNESTEDSWRDLANYAIIVLMLRKGIFTLPLATDAAK